MQLRRIGVTAVSMLVLLASAVHGQQAGTIAGQVVEEGTQKPLSNMQVQVVGTTRTMLTNEQGRFLFAGVPAGTYEVRVTGLGYGQGTAPVTVIAGQAVTATIALESSALQLDALVINAVTGQLEQKRELGNVVGRISAEQIEPAITQNLSQVLQARSPGVTVASSSGTSGTNQRIRIRGSNSISLQNDPLLIIDGVQVSNSSTGMESIDPNAVWVGGAETSRWNDLNPSQIESIEIIKGPAASALYGTAAANGVILVTTKRGRSGGSQWNAHVEYGGIDVTADFPANFQQIGVNPVTGARVASCNLDSRARGLCQPVADSLLVYNPLVEANPFRSGYRRTLGLSVTGGSESVGYFVSGETEREQGVLEPNTVGRHSFRANLNGRLRDDMNVTVTTGYVRSRVELPFSDNSSWGAMGSGLLAQAQDRDDPLRQGYFLRPPDHFFFVESGQEVNRFTGGVNVGWQPVSWLNLVAQGGLDHTARHDFQLAPSGISDASASLVDGFRYSNRFEVETMTGNLSGTATRALTGDLVSTTTVGGAYTRDALFGSWANGRQLLAGTGTLGGAAAGAVIDETAQEIITIGAYIRQQLAWRDRVFLTGALRGDDNSAFGADFEFVTYPAFSAAWVISDESFFPRSVLVDQLRLRGAYGQSGQRPGFRQARTYYNAVAVSNGVSELTAVSIGGTGNALLSPERSREWEAGFDLGLFDNRVGLELTYYDKVTRDALIARRLPPSLGASNTRFENIGSVSNRGVELQLNTQIVNGDRVQWDAALSASLTRNRVEDLGEGVEPIIFNSGSVQRHTEGFPLGSFFQKTMTFVDRNGDGMLSRANCPDQPTYTAPDGSVPACEITLGSDAVYLGTPFPKREIGFTSSLTLFDNLRLSGQLDYKGGHHQFNYTNYFRCAGVQNCEAVQVEGAPLEEQAAYFGARYMGTFAGYIEEADYLKLRELAVSYTVPERFTSRLGAGTMSITLAGRNLAMWTKYSGFDPEVNSLGYAGTAAAGGDFYQQDFLTLPPVRQWSARLNFTF
ncbi:MAG TPA: SusC/RagA family TonB-linked outer membrane protein [Longimicrobiales bacterium]